MVRLRGLLVGLVCVLVTGGCGSTLQPRYQTAAADRTQATAPVGTVPEEALDPAAAGATAAGVGAAAPRGAGAAAATSGPTGDYKHGVPFLTQGITERTIKVGVPTIANAEAITGLLGAADLNIGNPQLEAAALIADLNRRGGIAGRTIEPVYAPVDFGSPNIEASYLAACSKLADDAKVFIILLVVNPPPSFTACAAQKGVIVINGSVAPGDDVLIQAAAPWLYSPTLVSLSRVPAPLFDAMIARRLLTREAKVGVFAVDQPHYTRTAERDVIPALERRGITVAAYERVASEAAIQNAVLRFRQRGVTHVTFVQESSIPVLLFMRQAESQQFRPKYLLSSYDAPGYLLEGNVAEAQMAGVMGIGWSRISDVDASRLPPTPLERRCIDIIRGGGEPVQHRQSHLTAEHMCDLVWSFEKIATAAGRQLSTISFRTGFHSVGRGYEPVIAYQADLSSRIDGVSAYRVLGFNASCRCMDYSSGLEPLP